MSRIRGTPFPRPGSWLQGRTRLLARFLALALVTAPLDAAQAAGADPLPTIDHLDVPSYLGRWYEIAKFPNRFQRICVGDTTAQYEMGPQGGIIVRNRCRRADGSFEEATGYALQVGGSTSPRLRVRFAPAWLSFLPFVWGDYWVVYLDERQDLAAVSEPGREYLWILARTPTLDEARYAALLQRLSTMGLDPRRLEKTPQSTQP